MRRDDRTVPRMSRAEEEWPTLTPPLCERCWSPIRADEPVRRHVTPGPGPVDLVGFEHADTTCTPQEPTGDEVDDATDVDQDDERG